MARRYMTATQEWAADYERLHARPGKRGPVRLSAGGARILKALAPYPWEPGHEDVDIRGETLSWTPAGDSFVVGHAHEAYATGFPSGDAKRILDAFNEFHGSARTREMASMPGGGRVNARRDPVREARERAAFDRNLEETRATRKAVERHRREHGDVPVEWEPSREVKGQQGTMVLGGGEGLGLFRLTRRSHRRRYRNR